MSRRYWVFYIILAVLYVATGLVVCAELTEGFFRFNATHWLSLATIVGVVTGWAITSVVTLYNARRQHTIQVLLQSRLSPAYQQRMRDIATVYPTIPAIKKIAVGDWNDPAKLEGLEGIKYLLNYF